MYLTSLILTLIFQLLQMIFTDIILKLNNKKGFFDKINTFISVYCVHFINNSKTTDFVIKTMKR